MGIWDKKAGKAEHGYVLRMKTVEIIQRSPAPSRQAAVSFMSSASDNAPRKFLHQLSRPLTQ